jgi:hypothetical protein
MGQNRPIWGYREPSKVRRIYPTDLVLIQYTTKLVLYPVT